jgi:hypothetical protein
MAERSRLSEDQLKAMDALIAAVARRNIADQGRVPVEDWWDEAQALAANMNVVQVVPDAIFQAIHDFFAGNDPIVDLPVGDVTDGPGRLPASVIERFREAGPMPSLEDLILIRRKYQ